MNVLVVNCGSSSLKAALIDTLTKQSLCHVRVERIGESAPTMQVDGGDAEPCDADDHATALRGALPKLTDALPDGAALAGVGHRVVHGGSSFSKPTRIDEEVIAAIDELVPLAPLHNPANLAGIRAAMDALPDVPHVAVFDTAFHATLPRRARLYAIPHELTEKGYRRYGFHGPSHQFVAHAAATYLDADVRDLRIITCHLGNGASCTAVEYGRSVETSMGMTPLEGLVMGTRSGDIDPGMLVAIGRDEGLDFDGLDELLNRKSGLAGLSGIGNDMRDIEARAAEGDERCRETLHVFSHRVRKYIGAYAASMGGVDAIVFTAGIGQNSAVVRHRIAQRLDFLGARIDEDRNREAEVDLDNPVAEISTPHSRCRLLVARTDEEASIAEQTAHVVAEHDRVQGELTIPVAVSARHVHLTQETVEELFGEGYELTERNPLSQPGQFACNETVDLIGPKRTLEKVRILGPTRSKNQIEISTTDEFFLGVDAPVRASGDVANSPGITMVGAKGRKELKQGVICAWRHIHMTPEDAELFGVNDRDVVDVAINSPEGRDLIFGDVLIRVKSSYALEMHIDTDEANAAGIGRGATGSLVGTDLTAKLTRRRTAFDPAAE